MAATAAAAPHAQWADDPSDWDTEDEEEEEEEEEAHKEEWRWQEYEGCDLEWAVGDYHDSDDEFFSNHLWSIM